MPKTIYLVIAIITIVALIALFFITYVLNKRTPVPTGCEKVYNEHCHDCKNKNCLYHPKEDQVND